MCLVRWERTDILGTNLWLLCTVLGKLCSSSCFKDILLNWMKDKFFGGCFFVVVVWFFKRKKDTFTYFIFWVRLVMLLKHHLQSNQSFSYDFFCCADLHLHSVVKPCPNTTLSSRFTEFHNKGNVITCLILFYFTFKNKNQKLQTEREPHI